MHPIRAAYLDLIEGSVGLELFKSCAELEVLARLSKSNISLSTLKLKPKELEHLKSLSSISVESLYNDLKTSKKMSKEAPSKLSSQQKLSLDLLAHIQQSKACCDRSHWSINGGPQKVRMFKAELDRILLMARESLSVLELESLNQEDQGRIRQVHQDYKLNQSSEDLIEQTQLQEQAEEELERVILQMQIRDSFFGTYLAGCIRQVSSIIPTAGVAVRRDHIALVVNPHFFMNQLKDLAERAAVLKHEALHIMFKHVIMIRNDQFSNKRLYNIAADLEVNQYISHPWSLPSDAVTLDSFPTLDLPRNEVAEVYYKLLLKHQSEPNCHTNIQQITQRKNPSSDHQAWDSSCSIGSDGTDQQTELDLQETQEKQEKQEKQSDKERHNLVLL